MLDLFLSQFLVRILAQQRVEDDVNGCCMLHMDGFLVIVFGQNIDVNAMEVGCCRCQS